MVSDGMALGVGYFFFPEMVILQPIRESVLCPSSDSFSKHFFISIAGEVSYEILDNVPHVLGHCFNLKYVFVLAKAYWWLLPL